MTRRPAQPSAIDSSRASPGPSADDIRELDELAQAIVDERSTLDELVRERDRARATIAALEHRPATRLMLAVATTARRTIIRVRTDDRLRRRVSAARSNRILGRLLPIAKGQHRLRATARDEAALLRRLREAAARGPLAGSQTRVLAVIQSGANPSRLQHTIRAVETASADVRVAVIRADVTATAHAPGGGAPASGSVELPSWAEAIRAFDEFAPEAVMFVHDDIEAVNEMSFPRLIATLAERPDVAAVSGRLVLPRRSGPLNGPLDEAPDLTLAGMGYSIEPRHGRPVAVPIDRGGDPLGPDGTGVGVVPAASSAVLVVRRSALDLDRSFLAVADDLAPALDVRAGGGRIAIDSRAIFTHAERHDSSSTTAATVPWTHRLRRSAVLDRLGASGEWSRSGFHIGITVTANDESAGFGDWYTAHELGDALCGLGWTVSYLERRDHHWYEPPPDLDAILVLIDLFDLSRVPPGIIRIAWVRSWTDQWIDREWFDDYDIVLASSAAAKALIEEKTAATATVFPLATNPDRFAPGPVDPTLETDVAFVGSFFARPRDVARGLPAIARDGVRVGVWGNGWEHVPAMRPLSHGPLDYDRVPDVYRSTRIVVDDAVDGATRDLGQVNSRVFDALASGAMVVTNNRVGAAELMDDQFPTWKTPADLVAATSELLADEARTRDLIGRYRAVVLERHTYPRRAAELRAIVADWCRAERWAIAIGPRNRVAGRSWGDTYFARSLQRQLARRGRPTTVHVHDEWAGWSGRADVALHLFGARAPRPEPGVTNVLWVISHPDRIDRERCAGYDLVFVASDLFAVQLRTIADVPVESLHQATDPQRFKPTRGGPTTQLLFVGNSRGQRRPMVDAASASGFDLAVYGGGWTPALMDPRHLRGDWVPNQRLAAWYTGATIVLADHYEEMRALGFISNRIYDALACGAFVLSDDVPGLLEEFDGGAVSCGSTSDAIEQITHFVADRAEREKRAQRGRRAVLARHTFDRRADRLIEVTAPLIDRLPRTIEPARLEERAS